MNADEWEWHDVEQLDTVYANGRKELNELAETLNAVSETAIYSGNDPHNGFYMERPLQLENWR